jgi:hypothetical protein
MNPSAVFSDLIQDRTITVGGMFSFPTFFGGITLAEAHQWVGFYAVCVGAIGSTLVVIYTALKICRMMRDKAAKE